MKANETAAAALWWTRLRHRSLGSKQRQSSMAETEESTTEDKNNFTTNGMSDGDTEAEPQEDLCQKGGTRIPSFVFGLKSQTPTRQL